MDTEKTADLIRLVRNKYPGWEDCTHDAFVANELDYKQKASANARDLLDKTALAGMLEREEFSAIVDRVNQIGRSNNLLARQYGGGDLAVLDDPRLDHPSYARQLFDLLHGDGSSPDRLGRYIDYVVDRDLPNRWPLPTFLLFMVHPENDIFVKPDVMRWFLAFAEAPQGYESTPSAALYAQIQSLAQSIFTQLATQKPESLIAVQSIIWVAFGQFLAPPFDRMFANRAEADSALDLLADICRRVCETDDVRALKEDKRIALTLVDNGTTLRLNIGKWAIASFADNHQQMGMALSPSLVPREAVVRQWGKVRGDGETQTNDFTIRREMGLQMDDTMRACYERSMSLLADQFRGVKSSQHRHAHQPTIFSALFSTRDRRYRLAMGLAADDFIETDEAEEEMTPIAPPLPILYQQLQRALARRGQVILYGPPGTGKTYQARRYAVWHLTQKARGPAAAMAALTPEQFEAAENSFKRSQLQQRAWFVVANPKIWRWEELEQDGAVDYEVGNIRRHFQTAQPGDLVFGYESTPTKRIVALAVVSEALHRNSDDEVVITLKPLSDVRDGLTYGDLAGDAVLGSSEPLRNACRGRLFRLTESEAGHLQELLLERDPTLAGRFGAATDGPGQLTWTTFHPSYSYEDFVEGFRPVDNGQSGLVLSLEDGLFKQVCDAARADPERDYVLIIDEINRANLAKVFGELITLLEKDKRRLQVTLPQSKDSFAVPANVHIIGTMNTADRSIKLMDAALRRRFAFVEMMPDPALLRNQVIDGLDLSRFLAELNRRITIREGREKQIGHAYLMNGDGTPVDNAVEFAERFREEILPLLQEYCYDDYGQLREYIGPDLIEEDGQRLKETVLHRPASLIAALRRVTDNGAAAPADEDDEELDA